MKEELVVEGMIMMMLESRNDKVYFQSHSQSEPQRHHQVTKRLLIDFILVVV